MKQERNQNEELPDYGQSDPELDVEPDDLELIRWMLAMTPIERLRYAERFASGVRRLQIAGRD